jgi:methionyl-tRNA formyltransferase
MRTVFVGAVEGSAIALKSLLAAGMEPELVVTLPPQAASRHSDFIDLGSIAAGAPVHHTTNVNSAETLEAVKSVDPDLCLVIGWSQICRAEFRNIANLGSVGFHPAPLPRMRGRAVIPWTILEGETTSASSLFWLDDGVDSGDILLQRHFDVAPDETARTLYDKHARHIAAMVPEAIALIQAGSPPRLPQDHSKATYCAKRTPDDGLIDWRLPAKDILRLIRAVGEPYPGAFTFFEGQRVTIDQAIPHRDSSRFIGIAGQVQAVENGDLVIRCGNGQCIVATQWRSAAGIRPRTHNKFHDLYTSPGSPCP